MIGVQDPLNFASDQFSLRTRFLRQPTQFQRGYIKVRQAFPLALEMGPKSLADTIFKALNEMKKPTPPLTHAPKLQWMSVVSIRMIGARVDHRQQADHDRNVARTLTKSVINYLTVDTRRKAEAMA